MYNKRATETRHCIHMLGYSMVQYTIYMYNKRATETRHCIHMLGYSMVQYTCTTRGPQRLDTASTCWARQHGTAIYMYNKRATETRHCIHMLGYSMEGHRD